MGNSNNTQRNSQQTHTSLSRQYTSEPARLTSEANPPRFDSEPSSSGSSASASTTPPSSPKTAMWCYVKAKTRIPNSAKLTRRSVWYESKDGNTLLIGRGEGCDLKLDDDRCAIVNAKLAPSTGPGPSSIILFPESRMYRLVGMGLKRSVEDSIITVGSVIKLGSVSLEVTSLCTDENDDFFERFGYEIRSGFGGSGGRTPGIAEETDSNRNSARISTISEASADDSLPPFSAPDQAVELGNVTVDTTNDNLEQESDQPTAPDAEGGDEIAPDTPSDGLAKTSCDQQDTLQQDGEILNDVADQLKTVALDTETLINDDESVGSVEDNNEGDIMCYICWGGIEQCDEEEDQASDSATDKKRRANPMIRNPCGKCSGSSEFVHLKCILTWIESSGSGHCSICNGPLPQHFSSPPPNIELKVVRHRRGHSWVGTRRYRLSFAEREHATIGRDGEADVRLGDRSVCGMHAQITFDKATRQFKLSDCGSMTGTYMQVMEPMELAPQVTTYLKIGRTILSMRTTQRRNSILHHVLPPWKR